MFVLLRDVSAAKQVIATLLATALVLWASGLFSTSFAQAANITDVSALLTDTAPNASSSHTIRFTIPAGSAGVTAGGGAAGTIDVTYPAGFNWGSVAVGDIDMSVAAADQDITGADWATTVNADGVTFVSNAGSATAGQEVIITIGTEATGGTNEVVNPAPTNGNESFEIYISAGTDDAGRTRVVILDTVLVTAFVNTIFDFTVSGVASSTAVGGGILTSSTSASTSLAYGQLVADTPETLAQRLNVNTNAINGFVVTVFKDGPFESSTGADIDDFDDGVFSDTPAAWSAPARTLGTEDTYGHWGVTSLDTDSDGARGAEHVAGQYVSIGTSTSPTVVMASAGPTEVTETDAVNTGSTTVAYRVEISALQEAGDDYQAVLTYVATPTF